MGRVKKNKKKNTKIFFLQNFATAKKSNTLAIPHINDKCTFFFFFSYKLFILYSFTNCEVTNIGVWTSTKTHPQFLLRKLGVVFVVV